jgi:hypothetical protein
MNFKDNITSPRYALIAFDLDGTLLNAEGHLSPANRQALLEAMEKGVHICICTGRAYDTIPEEMLTFPGIEYAVSNNGASVYRIKDRCKLNGVYIDPKAVEKVIEVTKGERVAYEAFVDGGAFAGRDYVEDPAKYGTTPKGVEYVKRTRQPVDDIIGFMLEHKNELESMDLVVTSDEQKQHIMSVIKNATQDVYVTSSVKQLVELTNINGGKSAGLKFLAGFLGVERESIAAFGDADNDIDMIKFAGCGIAMENATESLKAVADHITIHHDSDGVAYAFRNILGIL